eukprot:3177400-Rhodomonas_salina.1
MARKQSMDSKRWVLLLHSPTVPGNPLEIPHRHGIHRLPTSQSTPHDLSIVCWQFLKENGVGGSAYEKLVEEGVETVQALFLLSQQDISSMSSLSIGHKRVIIQAWREETRGFG